MSLFYRRSIQEMLNHCSHFLTKEQLESFVSHLNSGEQRALHSQWELALLYALNVSGIIEHETDYKRRPDIRWISRDLSCEFIADVRTVSDDGYEEDNPREFYRLELRKRLEAIGGVDPSFFRDEPHHKMEEKFPKVQKFWPPRARDRKVKLLYPPLHESDRLFNQDFLDFVQRIKDNNLQSDQVRLVGADFDVTIFYQVQPGNFRIGGGNISYTIPYSLERNAVYQALKDKKRQLKDAEYSGIKGIILADGGCRTLTSGFRNPTGETYTDEDIVRRFLEKTKSISFVMTIYAKREQSLFSQLEPLKIQAKLFANPKAKYPLPEACINALLDMPRYIPKPKFNGENAARQLKEGRDSHEKAWYCGIKSESNRDMTRIYISSRSLADLLAQRITPEKFNELNNLGARDKNLFDLWLTQGMGISNASFERLDGDDDHIVLTYQPDFALKKFEVPKQGLRIIFLNLWRKTKYFPKKKIGAESI